MRILTPLMALAAVAPLMACGSLNTLGADNSVEGRGPGWPETQIYSAALPPVERPTLAEFASMDVRTLPRGEALRLDVTPFGAGVRVRESGGCIWTRALDWFSPSDSWAFCGASKNWSTAQARVTEVQSLYPLQVGSVGVYQRQATSTASGDISERETRCEAKASEAVRRPSGALTPAYRVECFDGRISRISWFAPGEGAIAYREAHYKRGLREAWVRVD